MERDFDVTITCTMFKVDSRTEITKKFFVHATDELSAACMAGALLPTDELSAACMAGALLQRKFYNGQYCICKCEVAEVQKEESGWINLPNLPIKRAKLTGLFCSVCGEPQFETPGGDCCINYHGGADGVTKQKAKSSPSDDLDEIDIGSINS